MLKTDQGSLAANDPRLQGFDVHVAIVQSRFNAGVTDALAQACRAELLRLGVEEEDIHWLQVPGALEIPVVLLALAETSKFDALIAIGCIIRGETYHFELVANESAAGVSRVALDFQLPVINAILTTDTLDQAIERQTSKGQDAARVAVEMVRLLDGIA